MITLELLMNVAMDHMNRAHSEKSQQRSRPLESNSSAVKRWSENGSLHYLEPNFIVHYQTTVSLSQSHLADTASEVEL